jgi:penicillin amidase
MIRSGAYVHDFVAEDLREPGSAPSLKKALGSATRSWTTEMVWGDIHRLSLGHPIGLIPVLGSSYRFIDEPWPGSTTTVNKSAHAITAGRHQTFFGANARLLIDMANPDASRVVLLGGQDGRVGSTAIIDQVPLWREGRFIPLPLSREGQVSRAKRFVRIEPTATANPERTTASYQSEANP